MPRSRRKKIITAVDLFSGCGGLTLGLKQAGFRVIGAVECHPIAAETYAVNHPEVRLWITDIRHLPGSKMRQALKLRKGQLDLLAGCPPCQGFSSLRTHNSGRRVRDVRNDLVYDYLRFVKALRPKTVMMENVPALAKNERMNFLKNKLKAMGYKASGTPVVLNAADYGVPQRRKRMILVGSRVRKIEMPTSTRKWKTVRQVIGKMRVPGSTGDPVHDIKEKRDAKTVELIKLIPKDGGSRGDLPRRLQLACHKKRNAGFADVYGRMKWNDVAPTITGGCSNPSKGRFLHPSQNRAITLREAALLQTFPLRYHFCLKGGKEVTALMIGNALPPLFIKQHALAIMASLQPR